MSNVFIIGYMLENTEQGPERRPVRINLKNVIYYKGTANNRTVVHMIGGRLLIEEPLDEVDKMIRNATMLPEPVKCAEGVVDKWHILVGNPNDLPPIERLHLTCEVLAYDDEDQAWLAYFSYETGKWYNVKTGVVLHNIVKWRYTN